MYLRSKKRTSEGDENFMLSDENDDLDLLDQI